MENFYKRLLIIGIAIGVFCSLAVFTVGQRLWTTTMLQRKLLESNICKIICSSELLSNSHMSLSYARQIQGLLPEGIKSDLKGLSLGDAHISFKGEPLPINLVLGTDVNMAELVGLQLINGRYFDLEDVAEHKKVCVLKSNVYDLIAARNAAHIDINGVAYEIVGIVSESENYDKSLGEGDVLVPVSTLYKHIENTSDRSELISQIVFDKQAYSNQQIQHLLQKNARKEGVEISDLKLMPLHYDEFRRNEAYLKEMSKVVGIALLILVIACFNIIYIATASIMDREREIGLHTALGAKHYHICRLIAREVFSCAFRGGLLGTATAAIFNTASNLSSGRFGFSFNVISLMAGLLLATAAGLLTSLFPAAKAAKLDPIAALREE